MKKYYIGATILVLYTLVVLVVAFVGINNPFLTKKRERDSRRSAELTQIKYAVDNYVENYEALPAKLTNLQRDIDYSVFVNKYVDYSTKGRNSVTLCTEFELSSLENNNQSYNGYPAGDSVRIAGFDSMNPNFYAHDKGNTCFTFNVTIPAPVYVPPVPRVQYDQNMDGTLINITGMDMGISTDGDLIEDIRVSYNSLTKFTLNSSGFNITPSELQNYYNFKVFITYHEYGDSRVTGGPEDNRFTATAVLIYD